MKKNISINISGIIFHIEEDGYERLKQYLVSINRYFATYEDSAEIIADIESRIAEIFLARLGDNKQVITLEDVGDLIATMGTVSDFEAAEEQYADQAAYEQYTELHAEPMGRQRAHGGGHQAGAGGPEGPSGQARKLYRDLNRKILGGVASGIAHYLAIDPLWVRLLFLATFFDVFFFVSVSGIAVISYVILWAITPGSYDLADETRYKRLFRDPENRVLGGVAAGLAAYFGVDSTVVRLLFILGLLLGGTGLIVYFIFWFIAPEAKTLTDRMQMEGEPVTLANIEKKIKESLNLDQDEEEGLFTKVLLFPFRLLAMLIDFLGASMQPVGGFLGQLVRVVVGGFMAFFAFVLVFGLLAAMAGLFGLSGQDWVKFGGVPAEVVRQSLPVGGLSFGLLVVLVPMIALALVGTSLLAGRRLVAKGTAITLFGVWLIGLVGAAATLPDFVRSWQVEADHRTETLLAASAQPGQLLALDLSEDTGQDGDRVELTVRGYDGPAVKLVKTTSAHGRDRRDAEANAAMLDYHYHQTANVLAFDRVATYKPNSIFRNQQVGLELLVPYGQEFIMKPRLARILRHTLYPFGYDEDHLSDTTRWVYNENGLRCLSCPAGPDANVAVFEREDMDGFVKSFGSRDFSQVSISENFDVEIRQADRFEVLAEGDQDKVAKVKVVQEGDDLRVSYDGHLGKGDVRLHIALPSLRALALAGRTKASVSGFEQDRLDLAMSDLADCQANLEAKEVHLTLSDKAELRLEGRGEVLRLVASGLASAHTAEFAAQQVSVVASDKAAAHVLALKQIEIASSGKSEVTYKGKPKVLSATGNYAEEE
jgi:phage shock protein PspC (stress-responsive transcriptional regulator)